MQELDLYSAGPAHGAKAPLLIAHLDGAIDAGSAGGLAVLQLLRNLHAQRVATFDADQLIDYRSHRPVMEVEDWVTGSVEEPEIALDLVHDDQGQPILVLHGPEPDARWHRLTGVIQQIVTDAEVEAIVSFHGLPSAVPHTRPTTVHVQSTDPDLVPSQPQMGGVARFPAPYTSYLQHRMQDLGLTGITLLATVPYYMSNSPFPRASSALLRRLSDMTGLSLPVGDLERGADEDAGQVEQLLEQNQDLQSTVSALESHYDSIVQTVTEGALSEDLDSGTDGARDPSFSDWERVLMDSAEEEFPEAEGSEDEEDTFADAIGEAIERYLKTQNKTKRRSDAARNSVGGATVVEGSDAGSSATQSTEAPRRSAPRHRAPRAWENDEEQSENN